MQHLVHESIIVYSQIRDELQRVIGMTRKLDKKYASFSTNLLHYYAERTQSQTILLQEWKLWDSDIIMRSMLECATRFLFVSIAAPEERAQRISEYTVLLSEIENLQRSEKAKDFVAATTNEDTKMLIGGVVLGTEHETGLRAKWPKAKRNALKQKWSFTEISRVLSTFHNERLDLRKYNSFLHGYGISSHLIHADQISMDLVRDRAAREPQEKSLMERAHFARLATEPVSILFLCWRAMAYASGVDSHNNDLVKSVMALNEEADVYHREFAESQRACYDEPTSDEK
jgi:hypothetical protein